LNIRTRMTALGSVIGATALLTTSLAIAAPAFASDGETEPGTITTDTTVVKEQLVQEQTAETPSLPEPPAPEIVEEVIETVPEQITTLDTTVSEPESATTDHVVAPLAKTFTTSTAVKKEVGLYLYPLLDATKGAGWENSGKQVFCDSMEGTEWFTTLPCELPKEVCGPAWGVQQDKVEYKGEGPFTWPASITYPVDNIGWPPIYADKHQLLSTLITVPDCAPPTGPSSSSSSTPEQCVDGTVHGGSVAFTLTAPSDREVTNVTIRLKDLGDGTGGTAETFYRADGTTGAPGEIVDYATVTIAAGQTYSATLSGLSDGNYRWTINGGGFTNTERRALQQDVTIANAECPIVEPVVTNPDRPDKVCPEDPSDPTYYFPGIENGPIEGEDNVYDAGNYYVTVDDQRDANGVGDVVFTNTPKEGIIFDPLINDVNEDGTVTYVLTYDGTECDVEEPPATTPPALPPTDTVPPTTTKTTPLAYTGADVNMGLVGFGGLMLLLGAGLSLATMIRGRQARAQ
jgi:hypothetical protein